MGNGVSRRVVLQLVGSGAAAVGATACSRGSQELIVPYVNQPPEVTPSVPTRYATVISRGGYGVGVLAESHEGRPTKLEGNPRHPASLGALSAQEQASLHGLYDPTRLQGIDHRGAPASWSAFAASLGATSPGKQVHVLLEPTSSPHLVALLERARARGDVVVHFDHGVSRQAAWEGSQLAFGRVVEPRYDLSRADVVVSLDADFLSGASTPHAFARAWAKRRRLDAPGDSMSRLYVVEPRLTVTGMAADERLAVQGRQVEGIAADLLASLRGLRGVSGTPTRTAPSPWVLAVARDLHAHAGASLVLAGDGQPPAVHALAHALNETLGNVGGALTFGASPVFEAGQDSHGLKGLLAAIDAGQVGSLVVVGGDPLYTAPPDLDLPRRFAAIPSTSYVGLRHTMTAAACAWICGEAHWLEAWSDALAFDGTPAIAQPLLRPLVDGRSAGQVLAAILGEPAVTSRDLVQAHWRTTRTGADFDAFWRESLVHGVVSTGQTRPVAVQVDPAVIGRLLASPPAPTAPLEIAFFADTKVDDGRFGDNAWLQELPDPVTKLTWDNAALLAPATAASLGVGNEQVVTLQVRERSVRAPVLVVPGMASGVVALAVGYGQSVPGRVSFSVGSNAYALRHSRAPSFDDVTLLATSETHLLSLAQEHGSMEGRPIVLFRTLDEYRQDPTFASVHDEKPQLLYTLAPDAPHQWGMTIDLNACTGCSACVVACMVENNIPTVGKTGVRLGRAMHWLRLDRYYSGDARRPAAVVQPMLCQHCENAPCEYVCPVNATVHSHDGLNEMVYNRCVGTRFCSNNCPYKVRRFNFFNYNAGKSETEALAMNPDVTVRARGVMEKCTYCVQRIREAEIVARREQRRIADGEIVTACQQTCPTGAILFGDIADPATEVSRTRHDPRLYQVLHDLGTVPRTRYLARIVHPNPGLRSP